MKSASLIRALRLVEPAQTGKLLGNYRSRLLAGSELLT